MNIRTVLSILPIASCLTFGCQKSEPPAEPPAPVVEPKPEPAPEAKSDPTCVGPIAEGAAHAMKTGELSWQHTGSTLKLVGGLSGKTLRIGVISDIKEASEENLANLDRFVAWFKKNKADIVVLAGDTGLEKDDLVRALEKVAGLGVPVFNIIGNREGKAFYKEALAAVRTKHPHVFDLNMVRRVDLPQADIISMPGYFNPSYLHEDDGCQYFEADVAAMTELAMSADSPVILVSHGGPLQQGDAAIDRTAEGENVGDPMLAEAIKKAKIPFGIFGNIHEAGGRGTSADGVAAEPGKPHAALYLNPGPADAVEWVMNDDKPSFGMAAMVTIKDGKATYEMNRAPNPGAKK